MKMFKDLSQHEQDELTLWHDMGCVQWLNDKWVDDMVGCELLPNLHYRIKPGTVKPRCIQHTRYTFPTFGYRVTTTPSVMTMLDGFGYTPEQAYNAWVRNHTCDAVAL